MADTFTPERIAQLRTQIAHMLAQIPYRGGIYALALNTLPAALDEIERLQEANEELERNVEIVSAEFEKDCWRAMRKLLEMTGYDFTDDGVTADEAFEHLYEDFKQSERDFDQIKAELSRVAAERDSLIDQVKAMTSVSADLSRVTAERDEAVAEMKRLRGSLEYIKAQSVSKAYATSPAMALNVIRANAEAALDNDFQTTVAEARSFLSRMGGRK